MRKVNVNADNAETTPEDFYRISSETEQLAEEVRLLSLNLAIAVARVQNREQSIKEMESEFSELIQKANGASAQVLNVVKAFKSKKLMLYSLPASDETIKARGAVDHIEKQLKEVNELSQKIHQSVAIIKKQKKVG